MVLMSLREPLLAKTTCPKCGYVRKPSETAPDWQCPSCGIVYAKFDAAPRVARIAAHVVAPLSAAPVGLEGKDAWVEGHAALAAGQGRLFVESKENLRLYAVGALLWVGFVAFILTGLFTTIKEVPGIAVPFFGVFLVFAGVGAVQGLRNLRAYTIFGTVRLALERVPRVGGELRGAVEFDSGAAALPRLVAELVCLREIPTARSNRNAPDPEVLFSGKAVLEVHAEGGHRRACFVFAIPASARPSGEEAGSENLDVPPILKWKLSIKGSYAGGDLQRSFAPEVLPAGPHADELPSQQAAAAAAVALVAANLLPLALVIAGLGNVGGLVTLYWAENVVIGCYTVLRMLEAGRGPAIEKASRTAFFLVHYGMFCLVQGILVTTFFLSREQYEAMLALAPWPGPLVFLQQLWLGANAMGLFSPEALLLPLLALGASHGVSFYTNYLRNGRYLTARAQDSFWRPYPRMILLQLCIIGGGIFIARHGTTVPLLAILVIGKTLMDLSLHRRANRAG
jgi:hypothetical protein